MSHRTALPYSLDLLSLPDVYQWSESTSMDDSLLTKFPKFTSKRSRDAHLKVERTSVIDIEQNSHQIQGEFFVFASKIGFVGIITRGKSDVQPIDRMWNGKTDQKDDLRGENFD